MASLQKTMFFKQKTVFFDRKTLFIATTQYFLIYYISGYPEKLCFSKNSAFHSINIAFCNKLCFSSEKLFFNQKTLFIGDKQSFLIYYTSGLREKLIYRVKSRVSEKKHCFSNQVDRLFLDRKTEFIKKVCFSI